MMVATSDPRLLLVFQKHAERNGFPAGAGVTAVSTET